MKRVITLSVIAAMTAMTLSAAERHHTVSGKINAITVARGAHVDYYPGAQSIDVVVSGPENYIPLVQVVKKDGTLYITLNNPDDKKYVRQPKDLKITLKAPAICNLDAKSSATLNVRSAFNAGATPLTVNASSSGDVDFKATVSSTGSVALNSSSSGDIDIEDLRASTLTISASSSGDVEIDSAHATTVGITASSSADVTIKSGALTAVTVNASSSGDVSLKNLSSKTLTISASSGADVTVAGASDNTTVKASSGADVDISKLRGGQPSVSKSSGASVDMPK